MRTLKLQMQVSLDGFVGGPNGEMDWMVWNIDDEAKNYITRLTEPVDLIVLGRELAEGFIPAWESRVANPETADWFAHKMRDTSKIVFSHSLKKSEWANTDVNNGKMVDEIAKLKAQPGKDIIAYGGATFVSNLIEAGLVDEFHLFVNPSAIGSGLRIFNGRTNLKLVKSQPFECGIVVLNYQPAR
jgi:dihydrofolate reductase